MSEQVTDLGRWVAEWEPASGRHAYDEDAALTPIFHALTRGGWRSRQHEPAHVADPVEDFHRDPLTAPIPVRAPASARRRELPETGRHRRRPVVE